MQSANKTTSFHGSAGLFGPELPRNAPLTCQKEKQLSHDFRNCLDYSSFSFPDFDHNNVCSAIKKNFKN